MKNKILPSLLLSSALVIGQMPSAQAQSGQQQPAQTTPAPAQQGQPQAAAAQDASQNPDIERFNANFNQLSRERHQGVHPNAANCSNSLTSQRYKADFVRPNAANPAFRTEVLGLQRYFASPDYRTCRSYELASSVAGAPLLSPKESGPVSQDGRISCDRPAGYTLDWESCKSAVQMYNMIVVADAALDLTQKMRTQQSGQKLDQKVAQEIQQGNGQDAIYEASVQHNRNLAGMHKEKVVAYTAAVAALGSKIASWQGKSDSALAKLCGGERQPAQMNQAGTVVEEQQNQITCLDALKNVRSAAFANDAAKGQLVSAFMEYTAKAVAAGIAAKNLTDIAKQVEQVKDNLADPGPTMFERCALNPMDPVCLQPGQRVPGQEYVSGDFNIDGAGNNVFGPSLEDQANIDLEDPLNNTPGDQVADASSPFEDAAKKANDIMDPAAAANVQPSGGAQGGGGGGAGGGMGGGGVSLGNDLKGPDTENKSADVKAEKGDGSYNFAGGGGFQAIKPSKDDANPFASLFDSQPAQGGITEDRSIASDDIGGKDSGLFLRISKRYGKISGEKRIEALNLE